MNMIATDSRDFVAEDNANRRPCFERVFLARAASLMYPNHPGAEVPADVAAFLLRKTVEDEEYDHDNTQDLYVGWCMAISDGAPGNAASAYRAQLEAQLRLAQAEVAQLKVSLQMQDRKFRYKVRATKLLAFLERCKAFFK